MSKKIDRMNRMIFSIGNIEIMAYARVRRRSFNRKYKKWTTIWNGEARRYLEALKGSDK